MKYKFEVASEDPDAIKIYSQALVIREDLQNILNHLRKKCKYGLTDIEKKLSTQEYLNHLRGEILSILVEDY